MNSGKASPPGRGAARTRRDGRLKSRPNHSIVNPRSKYLVDIALQARRRQTVALERRDFSSYYSALAIECSMLRQIVGKLQPEPQP